MPENYNKYYTGRNTMKCSKCGVDINNLNHFYIPEGNKKEGRRYCISCARSEKIITLV
jgi:peptide methionine sulfoxide reductase MsrB